MCRAGDRCYCPLALKVATCMTQLVLVDMGATALLLPVLVTTLSSAISPSGFVMIRDPKPVPGPVNLPAVIPAPKINSIAAFVFTAGLLALLLLPAAPAVTSNGLDVSRPLYSSTRTSTYVAAWLKVTVTVLLPAAIFLA